MVLTSGDGAPPSIGGSSQRNCGLPAMNSDVRSFPIPELATQRRFHMQRRMITLALAVGLALVFVSSAAMAQYQLTNLSSNQFKQARHDDPLLVNGWGLVHGPGSPWWVSDNGSGWSTLYDGGGVLNQKLKV